MTILQSMPHWQKMSLKIQLPRVFVVSVQSARCSGKCVSEQQPWAKYLKPPDFGRCIMSMYILVNRGAGIAMTGGMRILCV